MLRFIWQWVDKFKPSSINIFWDSKRDNVWRRKVFDGYKRREEDEHREDIGEELIYTQSAAIAVFKHMGVHQFKKDRMEADDLIYSACRVLSPCPIIICSTDNDYLQIVWRMQNVRLFDPQNTKF